MPVEVNHLQEENVLSSLHLLLQELRLQNGIERERRVNLVQTQVEEKLREATTIYGEKTSKITNEFEERILEIQNTVKDEISSFQFTQNEKIKEINNQYQNFMDSLKPGGLPWGSIFPDDIYYNQSPTQNRLIRIGNLSVDSAGVCPELPALFDISSKNLVIHTYQDASKSCSTLVKNIILKLLITFPNQMIKFHLMDPLRIPVKSSTDSGHAVQ